MIDPCEAVGDGLGQFKLECIITVLIGCARPKVYAFITTDGGSSKEVIKIKGLKSDVLSGLHIEDLEILLIEFTQDK